MAPLFNPKLVVLSCLCVLMFSSVAQSFQKVPPDGSWTSPWPELPKDPKDWTAADWSRSQDFWIRDTLAREREQAAAQAQSRANSSRRKRDVSPEPSKCASAWAEQRAESATAETADPAATPGGQLLTEQFAQAQRSGPEDYGYGYNQGPQAYPTTGSVFQHPNLPQFQRYQTPNSWAPANQNAYYPRSGEPQAYFVYDNQQPGQRAQAMSYDTDPMTHQRSYNIHGQSRSSCLKHPVPVLPDSVDTPAPNSASYRVETPQAKPQPSAEDLQKINQQYLNTYGDLYRQQIQQALSSGQQLVAGIPNEAIIQQFSNGAGEKLTLPSPAFITKTIPLTTLNFDPEEMRKVYGQYYVPPVFNLVQRQPNSLDQAPNAVVRDVLQYLLTQYNAPSNYPPGAFRHQRLLPDISKEQEKMLHGFTPLEKLPRQSMGDLLPPNVYKTDKWQPKTNLVVEAPVNLHQFEPNYNQMTMQSYPARSTPCSRHKRSDIWGYYPELAPQGPQPLPMYPGSAGRTAMPGLFSGRDDPYRQSSGYGPLGNYQQSTGYGQPMDQTYGNFPNYYSNYQQGRDALQPNPLEQVISGITHFVPMMSSANGLMNGLPHIRR